MRKPAKINGMMVLRRVREVKTSMNDIIQTSPSTHTRAERNTVLTNINYYVEAAKVKECYMLPSLTITLLPLIIIQDRSSIYILFLHIHTVLDYVIFRHPLHKQEIE